MSCRRRYSSIYFFPRMITSFAVPRYTQDTDTLTLPARNINILVRECLPAQFRTSYPVSARRNYSWTESFTPLGYRSFLRCSLFDAWLGGYSHVESHTWNSISLSEDYDRDLLDMAAGSARNLLDHIMRDY